MPRGRKTEWDKLDMANRMDEIESWANEGYTEAMIYHRIGVSHDTFYRWKRERPELAEALKRGKAGPDQMVKNALLTAALGYEFEEQAVAQRTGKIVTLRKYQGPNPTAAIFWLKNRLPQEFRDKQEHEHTGYVPVRIVDDLTEEDIPEKPDRDQPEPWEREGE
jgi:hypothetical protein